MFVFLIEMFVARLRFTVAAPIGETLSKQRSLIDGKLPNGTVNKGLSTIDKNPKVVGGVVTVNVVRFGHS